MLYWKGEVLVIFVLVEEGEECCVCRVGLGISWSRVWCVFGYIWDVFCVLGLAVVVLGRDC